VDLVQTVMTRTGVTEAQARQGLGTIFIALRMAADMVTFTKIASAFSDSGEWMLVAPFQSGGTGEMLALATPAAVRRLLAIAGFDEARSAALCAAVGEALQAAAPEAFAVVRKKLPLF
jgi:hypothetical protein